MNGVIIEEGFVQATYPLILLYSVFNTDKSNEHICLRNSLSILCLFSVVIENCVLCDKAIVRKGSNLKNCLVGSNHEVAENTIKEKAHLTNSDGYMEIE